MFNQSLIVGTLLVCSLWTEITIAGSSFLSPEQPKIQRKGLQKPATKFHRRDAEAALEVPGNEVEGTSNEMDIKVTVPFEISMKISEAQYKDCEQILEKFLEDILAGSNKENQAKD